MFYVKVDLLLLVRKHVNGADKGLLIYLVGYQWPFGSTRGLS